MTTKYFLGVDIGSTKCHAAIATDTGEVVGFGSGGAGNHESVGVDGFQNALHDVVNQALGQAEINGRQLAAMGLGIAGYDWDSDKPLMCRVIDSLGFDVPYQFVNDAVIGLIAGTSEGWGISITAGTSANCYGRDKQGRVGRVTGSGHLFGEYGGGWELVQGALAATSREWSMRGEKTVLTQIFVHHFQAKSVDDLFEGIVRGRYQIHAKLAPLVFEAVNSGDSVAVGLVKWISNELSDLVYGVLRQLDLLNGAVEVVLAGSFYKGTPLIEQNMAAKIGEFAPQATLIRLNAPPVVGAVMLAMETADFDYRPLRERLIESIQSI